MSDKVVIGVGSRVADVSAPALFFDGEAAEPVFVTVRFDDAAGKLRLEGSDQAAWPYPEIRAIRDQAGGDQMILRLRGNPVTRILLTDVEARRLIATRARDLHKRPPVPNLGRLWLWAIGAVASVALIILVLIPIMADQLAEYLPPEGEKALGDATFEQVRRALDQTGFDGLPICEGAAGIAALRTLETRLTDGAELATPLTVHVLDSDLVNAFALPGGYVVFFRGLIDEADSAEEVAAVFAHEIGHVAARDPTRIALRSAGSIGVLGLLFGDFAGGAMVLFLAERLIEADYSREAEAAADTFAHQMLLDADLPPEAIATFFERLQDEHGETTGMVRHLMSHPALGDRIAAARDAAPEGAQYRPALSEGDWRALRDICG